MSNLTQEWLDLYNKDKQSGKLGTSIFWRLAAGGDLPDGIDTEDTRVVDAIEHLKSVLQ